jgi:hypothetical protein
VSAGVQAGLLARVLERGERRLDALALVFGDQAGKHLGIVTETEFE